MARIPSSRLPRQQYVSLALVALIILYDLVVAVITAYHSRNYTPWFRPGTTAGIVSGIAVLWTLYLLFDLWSKYGISTKKPRRAWEPVIANMKRVYSFKWVGTMIVVANLVYVWVYVARNGSSFVVPTTCVPSSCSAYTTWLVGQGVISVLAGLHAVLAWRAIVAYTSEVIEHTDAALFGLNAHRVRHNLTPIIHEHRTPVSQPQTLLQRRALSQAAGAGRTVTL